MTTLTQYKDLITQANKIINRKTIYAAGAGLIPFPVIDTAALLGVQLTMIQSIGKLYNIPFKKHRAKSLVGSLIGSGGTVGLIKLVPGLGTVLGGTTAAVAGAAATYALGKVFTQHFDQGGTLLDFDPISSRAYFQKEFEKGSLYVEQQNIEIQGRTLKATVTDSQKDGNAKSTKELLLEETEALQKSLLQLQQDINTLQNTTLNNKQTLAATATKSSSKATKPKASKKTSNKSDSKINQVADFTIIEGIGPKIAELLQKAGIYSMDNLSTTSEDRLRQILKEAGGKFNFAEPSTWPQQAGLAAAGKMKELEALQKVLIGGKVKNKK